MLCLIKRAMFLDDNDMILYSSIILFISYAGHELITLSDVISNTLRPKTAAITILFLAKPFCRFFRRYQAEIPMTKIEASTKPDEVACNHFAMVQ